MPKMKSKRALMKRIRVTGSGKIKRDCAYRRHLAPNKTHKQKRHLRKAVLLSNTDYKRVKFLISKWGGLEDESKRWLRHKTKKKKDH